MGKIMKNALLAAFVMRWIDFRMGRISSWLEGKIHGKFEIRKKNKRKFGEWEA
jgi:hypothetical protein